ncbi:MAG: (E)-4-hydroxy-3-methylbut-2-enyl-diphosphate synthase [Taibaiella sp.]|nr:(E)-4-hydroxy-3-methylbut-2-enyl-diphosphate synthase [Taibaiella sp.]
MEYYCSSLSRYKRLPTREVRVGGLLIGNGNPIRIQTMTTTDTMDTEATVAQTIRCIEAGAELVRITAPSKKEAENLLAIKNEVRRRGYDTPLVADIHFTPNAAEIAARIVEKVRVNPGNYIDKKKFDVLEYTDAQYAAEVDRIRERFTPLVRICREHGTAMRIGTNHGSLSDRIMSRYGDTPIGMVESAMEFLRIARDEDYHQIILSMKSSNPQVMVQAYRLLVKQMQDEFGECYPLHLGVTEAGDGEDGRIKSAIGIGTLLEDGIGDTIRVSLTEDPEFEIPVCKDIVSRYPPKKECATEPLQDRLPYNPFEYKRRVSNAVDNIGGNNVPVVITFCPPTDTGHTPESLEALGYHYDAATDKWTIGDAATDYLYTGYIVPVFALPGTLRIMLDYPAWNLVKNRSSYLPVFTVAEYLKAKQIPATTHFVRVFIGWKQENYENLFARLADNPSAVLIVSAISTNTLKPIRAFITLLQHKQIKNPVIISVETLSPTVDKQLISYATDCGGLLLDGMGDGIMIYSGTPLKNIQTTGRTYLPVKSLDQFLNNTAFSILQATRTRISKTEYISCPSCGRTLFDLQETTAKIRSATHHLKGVKIAIMGCIVNGPGEMADADFGYVGSGSGKITLYKGKEVVKRNVPSETAVDELITLLKDNGAWVERN